MEENREKSKDGIYYSRHADKGVSPFVKRLYDVLWILLNVLAVLAAMAFIVWLRYRFDLWYLHFLQGRQ